MKNNETITWILITAAVIILFSNGFSMIGLGRYGYGYGGMMTMMYGYGLYGLASIFQIIYNLLIMLALVFLVVWLWQKIKNPGRK
jgi:uncharacterized membrane protein